MAAEDATDTTVTREVAVNVNNKIEITPCDIIMDENDVTESFTLSIETRPFPRDPSVNITPNVAIIGGRDDLFDINSDGKITLKRALDYETDQNHELTIRVDIDDEHVIKTLTINVRDVYDVPTISTDKKTIIIAENDADADLDTIITVGGDIVTSLDEDDFKITGEYSEKFGVAKNANDEWQLELTSALDYEAVRDSATDTEVAFDFQITITDDRGNSATHTIEIIVTDDTTETTPKLGTDIRDHLNGDANNDHICGYKGDDHIVAGAGSDTVYDGIGNDNLRGGIGADTLYGGEGDDIVSGGRLDDGADTLYGNEGNDDIDGHFENDKLYGGKGADTLSGGSENDELHGGVGGDIFYGGGDKDYFYLNIDSVGVGQTDIVADFLHEVGSLDGDVIRINTTSGAERSFEELENLGLLFDTSSYNFDAGRSTGKNDVAKKDTVISYNDIALMVIEDFTIDDSNFATVVEVV